MCLESSNKGKGKISATVDSEPVATIVDLSDKTTKKDLLIEG